MGVILGHIDGFGMDAFGHQGRVGLVDPVEQFGLELARRGGQDKQKPVGSLAGEVGGRDVADEAELLNRPVHLVDGLTPDAAASVQHPINRRDAHAGLSRQVSGRWFDVGFELLHSGSHGNDVPRTRLLKFLIRIRYLEIMASSEVRTSDLALHEVRTSITLSLHQRKSVP